MRIKLLAEQIELSPMFRGHYKVETDFFWQFNNKCLINVVARFYTRMLYYYTDEIHNFKPLKTAIVSDTHG